MDRITKRQLRSLRVSAPIYRWFLTRFPQGGDYPAVHQALLRDGHRRWIDSLVDYGYALWFDSDRFSQQELAAMRGLVDWLTGAGNLTLRQPGQRAGAAAPAYGVYTASTGCAQAIGSVASESHIALAGMDNVIGLSGDNNRIANAGYACQIVSSGTMAHIGNAGQNCRIGSLGARSRVSNSGNAAKISSDGRGARIANTGMRSFISSVAESTGIANTGDLCKVRAQGAAASVANTGHDVSIAATGDDAVIASAGSVNDIVLGKNGCAAVAYYDPSAGRTRFAIAYEGENGIQAGVRYRLDAQFQFVAVDERGASRPLR